MKLIKFECENCGRSISVPESAAGKSGSCKSCNTLVVVPSTTAGLSLARDAEIVRPVRTVYVPAHQEREASRDERPTTPHQTHVHNSIAITQVVSVAPQSNVGCLPAISVLCGVSAILVAWVPFLGLSAIPIAGTGIVFGVAGLLVSAVSRSGSGAPVLGILLCFAAIGISVASSAAGAVAAGKAIDAAAEKETIRQREIIPQSPVVNDPIKPPIPILIAEPNPEIEPLPVEPKNIAADESGFLEKKAASKLNLVKGMLKLRTNDVAAARRLREIIEQFPGTTAAIEASKLLEKLK